MRYIIALPVLGLSAVLAACSDSQGPYEFDPADSVQSRGTLLASGEWLSFGSGLVWVPGTELVAFCSNSPTYRIMTVDAGNGSTTVVHGACAGSVPADYLRGLVAAPQGSGLYFTGGSMLLMVDLLDGGVDTLRAEMGSAALALSADGRYLAYVAKTPAAYGGDGLIVRDLSSQAEVGYVTSGTGEPIAFSPDGSELLYHEASEWNVPVLRRLSLSGGTSDQVTMPDGWARLFRWGASSIEALLEHSDQPSIGPEYHVVNLSTRESVRVGAIKYGEGPYERFIWGGESWSNDGTRVAYWSGRCLDWAGWADCSIVRYALFVGDTRSGTWVRVAYTSQGTGSTVFSPDGRRLVYHASPDGESEGDFYVVDVP